MDVSVIVSVHNAADILCVTLPALLDQNYSEGTIELIVVDDCSSDATSALLENREWNDRCKIIRHEQNRGRCATRNSGIKAATGDLIVFIDCDIEVGPTFITKHVQKHKNPKVIGLLSNLRPHTDELKDKYHRYLFFGNRGAQLVGGHKPLPFKYFIMTCSSVKAEAVKKTGLLNENLPGYGIDLHYSYRLWKDFPDGLYFSPDITVRMHKLKSIGRALDDFTDYGRRNVPIILEEFPQLAPYMGVDFVKAPGQNVSVRSVMGNTFINRPAMALARGLYQLLPFPLSNKFVRYLMAASIVTGYRSSFKDDD